MTERDIRDIVEFVRSRRPKFSSSEGELKVEPDSHYFCSLYDRRSELLKGSKEYDIAMDEIYIQEAMKYFNYNET